MLCMAALAAFYYRRRHRVAETRFSALPVDDMEKMLNSALQQLNCQPTWTSDNGLRTARYDFQNGHFQLRIKPESPYVQLHYLFFFATPAENLNIVRTLVNHCNQSSELARIVYSVNEEKHQVDLHVLSGLSLAGKVTRDTLLHAMTDAFGWQASFVKYFSEMLEYSKKIQTGDLEKEHADTVREAFLLREQEIMHQVAGPEWRCSEDHRITLSQLLSTAMTLQGIDIVSLMIIADGEQLAASGQATDYDLSQALIADGQFIHREATLLVQFTDPRLPQAERRLCVMLHGEERSEASLYYRATIAVEPLPASSRHPVGSIENTASVESVLMAFDLSTPEQRLAEFRYMWKEAMGKARSGEWDALTAEQRLLCHCMDPQIGYHLYWGRVKYRQKRFMEALCLLGNAYQELVAGFDEKTDRESSPLPEVCYLMGLCYSGLRQYDRAYYYLEMVLPTHRISYTEAYVNCLVNSGDLRAMGVIDGMLSDLEQDQNEDAQHDTHMMSFVAFLKRRKAHVLISRHRYEAAEQILRQLLDAPDSSDYAIGELAYIQRKKKEQDYVLHPEDI